MGKRGFYWKGFVNSTETISSTTCGPPVEPSKRMEGLSCQMLFLFWKHNVKSLFLSPDHGSGTQIHFGKISPGKEF